jgi:hypothetical protein
MDRERTDADQAGRIMRRVEVLAFCDVCMSTGQEVPGYQLITLTVDRVGPLQLDLCLQHTNEVMPILNNLLNLGHREIAQTPRDRKIACPLCDRSYPDKRGLRQHLKRLHDTTMTELARTENTIRPELVCPECADQGVEFVASAPQGLGAHRRSKHDVRGRQQPAAPDQQEALVG